MLILSICSLAFLQELGVLTKIDIQNKNIDRIKAYENAGADVIFHETMKDEKEYEKLR